MGLLEDIIARSRVPTFPGSMLPRVADPDIDYSSGFPQVAPPVDEAAAAAEARDAAGRKLILSNRRRPLDPLTQAPDAQSAGVQLAMNAAPPGTGVPFSTGAGMLAPPAPPVAMPAQVPMPVPRPPGADAPPSVDIGAAQRQPGAPLQIAPQAPAEVPAAPAAAAPAEGGGFGSQITPFLSKIAGALGDRSSTLLALGAGFAGAPNIGQGISRAAAAAIPAQAADQKRVLLQQQMAQSYRALIDAKVPPNLALAAMTNPEIMKSVTVNYLGDRKAEVKTIKDALGNERLVAVNPYDLTSKDITGGGSTTPAAAAASQSEPTYDPVTRRDEGYLKSLDPITAQTVKNIADGKAAPSGRNMQKYLPLVNRYEDGFDQARYNERNKLHTELGSQAPSSIGGQITLIPTALGHLADVAEHMAELGNVNGLGSADVGHATNWVRNRTTKQSAIANALNDGVAKFSGEVGKIYSGSTGGGVHEREETRQRLGSNLTAAEQIAALETSKDLLQSKIDAVQGRADAVLGPGHNVDAIGKTGRDALARIDKAIAKLKGDKVDAPATTAAPAASPAPKLPPGKSVTIDGVVIRRIE